MQKDDSKGQAPTAADSEQKDQDLFVSQHIAKPNVVGSQCLGTEKESVNPEKQSAELSLDDSDNGVPDVSGLPELSHTSVRPGNKNEKVPRVEERFYDTSGKIKGVSIIVAEGELSVTGKQFAEWYRQKFQQ